MDAIDEIFGTPAVSVRQKAQTVPANSRPPGDVSGASQPQRFDRGGERTSNFSQAIPTGAPWEEAKPVIAKAQASASAAVSSQGHRREAGSGPVGDSSEAPRRDREYLNIHCYGGRAALCFSADTTKAEEAPTVRIEAAASTGPRSYAWGQKIAAQCTLKELPVVLATLMGWMPSVRFAAHGHDNKKGFSFQHQEGGKLFAKVWDDKTVRMVPIAAMDVFAVADLFVRQMLKTSPHLSSEGLLMMVRQLSRSYAQAGLGEQERRAAD